MQYLSCFNALGANQQPTVLFFDRADLVPELAEENVESIVRTARSSLGVSNLLNPVRGQLGDKYFLTYAKYGKSNSSAVATAAENTALNAVSTVDAIGPIVSDPAIPEGEYPGVSLLIGNPIRTPILLPELPITNVNCPTYEYIATYSQGGTSQMTAASGATGTVPTQTSYTAPSSPAYGSNRQRTSAPKYAVDGLTQPYLDYPVRAIKLGGNSGTISFFSNSGDGLAYSSDVIKEEDETVNLNFAYMFMEQNICILQENIDYSVAQDLVPGTRPRVAFPVNTCDL